MQFFNHQTTYSIRPPDQSRRWELVAVVEHLFYWKMQLDQRDPEWEFLSRQTFLKWWAVNYGSAPTTKDLKCGPSGEGGFLVPCDVSDIREYELSREEAYQKWVAGKLPDQKALYDTENA